MTASALAEPKPAPSAARPRLIVWRLVDGKPGHEKQSAALLQGIEELLPVEVYDFDMRFKALLWRQVRGHAGYGPVDLPAPDLILGVGHRTHLPMLSARAACGGKCVVLMRPTLPHRLFDLIFVPHHDRYRRKANLVETIGVVCPAIQGDKTPDSGLVLLGGASRHFEWTTDDVAAQVAAIARAAPDVHWQVCDSRRTPADFRAALPAAPNLRYRPWQSVPSDFLEKTLAAASYVWVTADSASMLYESLSAGTRVGVIALDLKHPHRDNKHARGLRLLLSQGRVFSSTDGVRLEDEAGRSDGLPPEFQPESRRCAKIVVERLWGSCAEPRPADPDRR